MEESKIYTNEAADTGEVRDNDTLTQNMSEEQARFLTAEVDRRVGQAQKKWEKEMKVKLEKAELTAKSAESEKNERREGEISRLKTQLEDSKRECSIKDNKLMCLAELEKKGLPTQLIDLIVCEDSDMTNSRLETFEAAFRSMIRDEVSHRFAGSSPKSGDSAVVMTKDEFRGLSLSERQSMYLNNREAYNELSI